MDGGRGGAAGEAWEGEAGVYVEEEDDWEDEGGFDDYTLASPFEKLVAAMEQAVRGWLSLSAEAVLDQSFEAWGEGLCGAAPAGGALRCLRATLKPVLQWRPSPYQVLLFFPPPPAGEGLGGANRGSSPPPAAGGGGGGLLGGGLLAGAHPLQRWLGLGAGFLVAQPDTSSGASGRVLDPDEATCLLSAAQVALSGCEADWPVLVPVGDGERDAYCGAGHDLATGVSTKLEVDSVSNSRPQPGLVSLQSHWALLSSLLGSALPAGTPAPRGAVAYVRQGYTVEAGWADARAGGGGAGGGTPHAFRERRHGWGGRTGNEEEEDEEEEDDDEEDEEEEAPRRDWDEGCPWRPWVHMPPPVGAIRLDAFWDGLLVAPLVEAGVLADMPAETAHRWLLRWAPPQGGGSGLPRSRALGGGGFSRMLQVLAAGEGGGLGATSVAQLATDEWWESAAELLSKPPEAVVEAVLRDLFSPAGGEEAAMGRWKEPQNSAPPGGLLARLALHSLLFGNIRAVALLWVRFVRVLRFKFWDDAKPLPRMAPPGEDAAAAVPDHRASLLHQKLQMLAICIHRRAHGHVASHEPAAGGPGAPTRAEELGEDMLSAWGAGEVPLVAGEGEGEGEGGDLDTSLASDGWEGADLIDEIGRQPLSAPPPPCPAGPRGDAEGGEEDDEASVYESCSEGEEGEGHGEGETSPRGVAGVLRGQYLLRPPHPPMHCPRTQEPVVSSRDTLLQRESSLAAMSDGAAANQVRQKIHAELLQSDMAAFKAANPGAVLGDFVRWHSPRDWEAAGDERGEGRPEGGGGGGGSMGGASFTPPRGRLSRRMRTRGSLWGRLWKETAPCPAEAQRPLMDPTKEGEAVLHHLENIAPAALLQQLLAAAFSAAGGLLAAAAGARVPAAAVELDSFASQLDSWLDGEGLELPHVPALCSALSSAEAAVTLSEAVCPPPLCSALSSAEAAVTLSEAVPRPELARTLLSRLIPGLEGAVGELLARSLDPTGGPPVGTRGAEVAEEGARAAAAAMVGGVAVIDREHVIVCDVELPGVPGVPAAGRGEDAGAGPGLARSRLYAKIAPGEQRVATAVSYID